MTIPTTVRWVGLALLGIAIAAAVSVAASRLSSQNIGLASEPLSAGRSLAPARPVAKPVRRTARKNHRAGSDAATPGTHSAPKPPAPPPPVSSAPVTPAPTPAPAADDSGGTSAGESHAGGADD
jgi:hypothetical protein